MAGNIWHILCLNQGGMFTQLGFPVEPLDDYISIPYHGSVYGSEAANAPLYPFLKLDCGRAEGFMVTVALRLR